MIRGHVAETCVCIDMVSRELRALPAHLLVAVLVALTLPALLVCFVPVVLWRRAAAPFVAWAVRERVETRCAPDLSALSTLRGRALPATIACHCCRRR